MAHVLKRDKKVAVITQLLEGSSVRSTERITGVHRDTILRLMVRVAGACAAFSNETLVDLNCKRIEVDEIWAFVAKKNKNVVESDDWSRIGDQYTFVAIDPETKLIPSYKVGKRTAFTTMEFIDDLAARLGRRMQISSDGFAPYYHAIATAFPTGVDYATIVKEYAETAAGRGRYSPPKVISCEKGDLIGLPVMARPRKPRRERKESIIQIRVNAEQKTALAEKARLRGLGLSSWLLSLGMSAPERPTGA